MVTHQLQVRCRPVKVRRSKTNANGLNGVLLQMLDSLTVIHLTSLRLFYQLLSFANKLPTDSPNPEPIHI